jgi:hypothetical protein
MSYLFVLAFAAMATYGAAVKQHPSVVYALNAGGAELVNNGVVYASDLDAVSTASPVSLRCMRRREGEGRRRRRVVKWVQRLSCTHT